MYNQFNSTAFWPHNKMNNKHLGEKINSGQQQDDHKMSRMETMNEEASRLIGGGGQNQIC
jgi:hypothetical protein